MLKTHWLNTGNARRQAIFSVAGGGGKVDQEEGDAADNSDSTLSSGEEGEGEEPSSGNLAEARSRKLQSEKRLEEGLCGEADLQKLLASLIQVGEQIEFADVGYCKNTGCVRIRSWAWMGVKEGEDQIDQISALVKD